MSEAPNTQPVTQNTSATAQPAQPQTDQKPDLDHWVPKPAPPKGTKRMIDLSKLEL